MAKPEQERFLRPSTPVKEQCDKTMVSKETREKFPKEDDRDSLSLLEKTLMENLLLKNQLLEKKEPVKSKVESIFDILDNLPFALKGQAKDIIQWDKISEALRKKDFADIDEFKNCLAEEMNKRKWTDEEWLDKTTDYIERMTDLIQKWQRKNN